MAYASRSGRARTNSAQPEAFAVCDRCSLWTNFSRLRWQYQWQGAALANIRLLVCPECYDVPQQQLRAIVLPPDPVPIINARTENFLQDESDFRTEAQPLVLDPVTGIPIPGTTTFTISTGGTLTTNPMGFPVGLDQNAVMPLEGTTAYGVPLDLLSVTAVGTTIITATCRSPHGLTTNDQISVAGLSDTRACGFYSVNVTTATALTWTTQPVIPPGSLLTPTTRIVTANVGLPRGYVQVPAADGGQGGPL